MTATGYAKDVLVDADWAAGPHRRPERPLRRGRRRHDGLRRGPHPRRRRLELDQPAVGRPPPRHRQPRRLQPAPARLRHRPGHDDRALRRQQQLVRRLGVLAAQAVRRRRRPDPRRRAQATGSRRACRRRPTSPTLRADRHRAARPPTSAIAPSATTSCQHVDAGGRARRRPLARPSSAASCSRPRRCRRKAPSAPATSPAPRTSRGPARSTRTARSRTPTSSASCTRAKGITADKDVIAYCRIGERSSHTWFVLHELLGFERVRNYDGSWTEYGSLVGVPIEKSIPVAATA